MDLVGYPETSVFGYDPTRCQDLNGYPVFSTYRKFKKICINIWRVPLPLGIFVILSKFAINTKNNNVFTLRLKQVLSRGIHAYSNNFTTVIKLST